MRRRIVWVLAGLAVAGCGGGGDGGPGSDAGPSGDAGPSADGGASDDGAAAADAGGGEADGGGGVDSGGGTAVPSAAGPFSTAVVEDEVMRDGRRTPVAAHVPEDAGARPLVVFVPGFQLESSRYAATAEHVASHGFVVVRADPPDPLTGVDHVAMAADVSAVIDWALDASGPLAGAVDSSAVATAGHSLGGKVATMVAHDDDRVKALLGLDPVNGGNPFSGYSESLPDIVPELVQELDIPVGFAGETLDGTASGFGGMACAPEDQSYQTFYDAATSAPWAAEWTFEGADHMDFVDDTSGCGFTCSACQDGSADEAQVHAAMHTLAAAFALRHLQGDASMEPWLTGASVPSGVATESR